MFVKVRKSWPAESLNNAGENKPAVKNREKRRMIMITEYAKQSGEVQNDWACMEYGSDLLKVIMRYRSLLTAEELRDGILGQAIVASLAGIESFDEDGNQYFMESDLESLRDRFLRRVDEIVEDW